MQIQSLKCLATAAVRALSDPKSIDWFLQHMLDVFADSWKESDLFPFLKVLTEDVLTFDCSFPVNNCFAIVASVLNLTKIDWISEDPQSLSIILEWTCDIFCRTHQLSTRPVRVDSIISLLCKLSQFNSKYELCACKFAMRLSFDRCFRLGLLEYENGNAIAKLIIPFLRIPPEFIVNENGKRCITDLHRTLFKLKSSLNILSNLANSSDEALILVDKFASPCIGSWLQSLYFLLYSKSDTNTSPKDVFRPSSSVGLAPIKVVEPSLTPDARYLYDKRFDLAVSLDLILDFSKKLADTGNVSAFCGSSDNVRVIVSIALQHLAHTHSESNLQRSINQSTSSAQNGEKALLLFHSLAKNFQLCDAALFSIRNSFLKKLLCFGFLLSRGEGFKKTSSRILRDTLVLLAGQSLLLSEDDSNSTQLPFLFPISWSEQIIVLKAFAIAYLDLSSDIAKALKRDLRGRDPSSLMRPDGNLRWSTRIGQLVHLAKNSANDLLLRMMTENSTASLSWGTLIWISLVGFLNSLLSKAASKRVSNKMCLFSGEFPTDDIILDSLCEFVETTSLEKSYVKDLLTFAFTSLRSSVSESCVYRSWLQSHDTTDNSQLSFLCLSLPAVQDYDVTLHIELTGWPQAFTPLDNDAALFRIPVDPNCLTNLSSFFGAIFSRRWNSNFMAPNLVILANSASSSKHGNNLWPVSGLLLIIHLMFGCDFSNCSFLRSSSLSQPSLVGGSDASVKQCDLGADLICLCDRLLINTSNSCDFSPSEPTHLSGSQFIFNVRAFLLSSLLNSSKSFPYAHRLFKYLLRLSAFLCDSSLFTALVWLAFSDWRWTYQLEPCNSLTVLLNRPLTHCLYNVFQYHPFWCEGDGGAGQINFCKSVIPSFEKIALRLSRSLN